MEDFYIITMKTNKDKKLYLSVWDGKPEWTFNKSKACFWDFEDQALDFAKRWFKNFKDWEVEEVRVNIYEEIF